MPYRALAKQMSTTELDTLLVAFWREKFPTMDEVTITVRAAGQVVGYRLVDADGWGTTLSPPVLDAVLTGV